MNEETVPVKKSIFSRSDVFGCPVDQMTLDECIDVMEQSIKTKTRCHLIVVNAAKVVKSRSDKELETIIREADIVGADGVPVVWASKILGQPLPGRVNGTDVMERLIELSDIKGYTIFLLGAKENVIKTAVDRLHQLYPSINIVGYRNGYFNSVQDEQNAIRMINNVKPDILLIGMGTPMKEQWVKRHKHNLNVGVIHGVGGSFDILGGVTKRAPRWMQKSGLEWFYRLLQEPRRMWKRYLITNTMFLKLMFKASYHRFFSNGKAEDNR